MTKNNLTGDTNCDSSKRNAPKFSFGSKIEKPSIISKRHIQDLMGKESPGAGSYSILAQK